MNKTIQLTTNEINDIAVYWEALSHLSAQMKQHLAKMLTASVVREKTSGLSDEELQKILCAEQDFAQCTHNELSDEQYKKLIRTRPVINQGLRKWL